MPDPAPYQRIKDTLLERVHSGLWQPGDSIPGEQQLAVDFNCARSTVHRALRELAEEGVLERKRKTGTRVAYPTGRSLALDISLVEDEIKATGASYQYQLLERKLAPSPPTVAAHLNRAPGEEALHLLCLHYADRHPYQLEDRWIDPQTVPEAREEGFDKIGPNPWLLRNVPWTEAEHVISADLATGTVASALGLKEGEPVLIVERRTWNAKGPVTTVRFHHPGRTHRLRSAFAPR